MGVSFLSPENVAWIERQRNPGFSVGPIQRAARDAH